MVSRFSISMATCLLPWQAFHNGFVPMPEIFEITKAKINTNENNKAHGEQSLEVSATAVGHILV